MAKVIKWLGIGLGWTLGGPIGALIGFFLGKTLENISKKDFEIFTQNTEDPNNTNRRDFEISLLVLSTVVIKANGRIDQRERDFVRNYFIKIYGKQRAESAFRIFKAINQENISTRQVCQQIRRQTTHAARLQLMHYLFQLAKADTLIDDQELQMLKTIARYLYVSDLDFDSIANMFKAYTASNPYKILELKEDASVADIKKAYRKMVKKHHPDKLRGLGAAHVKAGEEKFIKIQQAYDQLKKMKNF